MSDVAVTAANVLKGAGGISKDFVAGAAITAGMSVYLKTTDQRWYPAKADVLATSLCQGVSLHPAAIGQPLQVQTSGPYTCGATVLVGVFYYVSAANAGGFCPVADLASGNFPTLLGFGLTTTTVQLMPTATGLALA